MLGTASVCPGQCNHQSGPGVRMLSIGPGLRTPNGWIALANMVPCRTNRPSIDVANLL